MLVRTRVESVLRYMQADGLEQLLISSTPSIYYLTGRWIEPGERMVVLYLNRHGEVMLFANRLFSQTAEPGLELYEYTDTQDPVALLASKLKPGKLGIDKNWPSRFLLSLMAQVPGMQPVNGSNPVDQARMRKDAAELQLMRESSRMNDEALQLTRAQIREGMTELELAETYARCAREAGGDGNSFEPIACFGANCAEPHHANDTTRLKKGDSIILDVGLMHRRYCSDMTRSFFFGGMTDEQARVYDVCLRANEAGRAAVRPGLPMSAFDHAARAVIEAAGYGEYFIHRTGHGIGLDVHEFPDNSATSTIIAEPGMVFSVEPGIYLPHNFGVRIEDLIAVTPTGSETLNTLPRQDSVLHC